MCQSCDNRSRVLKTGFAQLVGWAAQLIQLRHDDSRTLSLCTNSDTSIQADPELAHQRHQPSYQNRTHLFSGARVHGENEEEEGIVGGCLHQQVLRRPDVAGAGAPGCHVKLSHVKLPIEVPFFSVLHFGSVIIGLLYLRYLPSLLVFSVSMSNPMIFQS